MAGGRGECLYKYVRGIRFYCTSVQAMLNQTAVNDLKGESFPLDFNLQDVTHHIEVEINPRKYK